MEVTSVLCSLSVKLLDLPLCLKLEPLLWQCCQMQFCCLKARAECPRALLLQCLSLGHADLLLLMCNLKEHFKACGFCKDKKLQDVRKDAFILKLALLPDRIFTVTCSEPFRTCLGWAAWASGLALDVPALEKKSSKLLAPHHKITSLLQKLIDLMGHGISMALTSLHDPVVPHNCSIHLSKTGIVVWPCFPGMLLGQILCRYQSNRGHIITMVRWKSMK